MAFFQLMNLHIHLYTTESFFALGEIEKIAARSNHVVYSDNERIMCWLWNHKDSAYTCIDESSKYVLFFIDSCEHDRVELALKQLAENLTKIQSFPLQTGILNRVSPQTCLTSSCLPIHAESVSETNKASKPS